MLVELAPPQDRADDARRFVEDLQRFGAQHRPGARDALVVQWHVEVIGGEQRSRRSAGRPELQLVAFAHAAGQIEEFAQGDAQRRFVPPRIGDVARE